MKKGRIIMLKGIQKKMIAVNITDSKIFECAYFIMKNHVKLTPPEDNAVLLEANRIIAESLPKRKKRHIFLKLFLILLLIAAAAFVGRFSYLLF